MWEILQVWTCLNLNWTWTYGPVQGSVICLNRTIGPVPGSRKSSKNRTELDFGNTKISTNVQDDSIGNPEGKPITGGQLFRKYLLNRCQEDFERGWWRGQGWLEDEAAKAANAKIKEGRAEEIVLYYSDEYYTAQKAKQRGLIKFIGGLFKLWVLTGCIMHECQCVKKILMSTLPSKFD